MRSMSGLELLQTGLRTPSPWSFVAEVGVPWLVSPTEPSEVHAGFLIPQDPHLHPGPGCVCCLQGAGIFDVSPGRLRNVVPGLRATCLWE